MMHKLAAPLSCSFLLLFFAGSHQNASGAAGYALQFIDDGNNQFVSIPFMPSLNLYPFTVTAWIKAGVQPFDAFQPTPVISKNPNSGPDGWSLSIYQGAIRASYYTGSGLNYVSDGSPPQLGLNGGFIGDYLWHHVAFTVDASGGKIYVDGVLGASGGWVGSPGMLPTSVSPIYMGRGPALAQFVGLLDEVSLWSAALPQAQILTNKNRSLSGAETNLIAYYRCDEAVGPVSYDSAPAGGDNRGQWSFGITATPSDAPIQSPPRVQTYPAASITATSATLAGVANPSGTNTFVWFEWGTTADFGNVTVPQFIGGFTNDVPFGSPISGLSAGVTYYFRAAASNIFGVVYGVNRSFTTPTFQNINGGFTPAYGGAAWADYDNDGWLDFALGGYVRNGASYSGVSEIWRNNGSTFNLTYTNFMNSLEGYAFARWGEANNDGRLDLILGFRLFRNTLGGFTNYLGGYGALNANSSAAWGDFDNDGLLDILGDDYSSLLSIMRNTGIGFGAPGVTVPSFYPSAVSWGDYDKDGRLDIFAIGSSSPWSATMFRNWGGGFTNAFNLGACFGGAIAWGDYDNDGRTDLLVAGATSDKVTNTYTRIWRNTPSGFVNINADLPGVALGSVAWGDCDNDGRLDIILSGTNATLGLITQIWRNTGSGFTNLNAGLPGLYYSSVAWGDYDNDSRLDVLLCGVDINTQFVCQVWRNLLPGTNTPPSAPTGLSVVLSNSTAILSWMPASDAQTPAGGLTYNVRVGSSPGAADVMSAMALPSGKRNLPQDGNAGARQFALFNYVLDKPYYWSVQAIDSAFAGSSFAPDSNFRVLRPSPMLVSATVSNMPAGDTDGDGLVSGAELQLVYSNYFSTSPWLKMTNVAGLGSSTVTFALTNDFTGAWTVEYTTNFADWLPIGFATPRYEFTDTNAVSEPKRYYRLRWP